MSQTKLIPISVAHNPVLESELNDNLVKAVIVSGNRVWFLCTGDRFIEVGEDVITRAMDEEDELVADQKD